MPYCQGFVDAKATRLPSNIHAASAFLSVLPDSEQNCLRKCKCAYELRHAGSHVDVYRRASCRSSLWAPRSLTGIDYIQSFSSHSDLRHCNKILYHRSLCQRIASRSSHSLLHKSPCLHGSSISDLSPRNVEANEACNICRQPHVEDIKKLFAHRNAVGLFGVDMS
jgi:hypothetical protein